MSAERFLFQFQQLNRIAVFRAQYTTVPFYLGVFYRNIEEDCEHLRFMKVTSKTDWSEGHPCCAQYDLVNNYAIHKTILQTCAECPFFKQKEENLNTNKKLRRSKT